MIDLINADLESLEEIHSCFDPRDEIDEPIGHFEASEHAFYVRKWLGIHDVEVCEDCVTVEIETSEDVDRYSLDFERFTCCESIKDLKRLGTKI